MKSNRYAVIAERLRKSFPVNVRALIKIWLGLADSVPSHDALKGVDIRVPEGEMVGILGRNGAGKSTLLRTLAQIYPPDDGVVQVRGEVAGLFELGGFGSRHLTGRAFVRNYFDLINVPRADREKLMADIIEFSELGPYFDQRIRTYSAGMAARLYFAAATAAFKDVYLIDEILSVGDEHFQAKSWSRMRKRLTEGVSGILVTHDWSAVVRLCRTAHILEHGRLIAGGPADQVVTQYLQLPAPQSNRAEIIPPDVFHAETAAPLKLEFDVILHEDIPVDAALSVEYLTLGAGWEIILLTEYSEVGTTRGRYRISFEFPYAPLRPGEYKVAIFLTGPLDSLTGSRPILQGFSWTYGNGLKLIVSGPERSDLAPFPIKWEQVA